MPRFPRDISDTGIYHVMIRGINKMNLFHDKTDKLKLTEIISKMKTQGEYSLYAYCIMNNHAHLLLKEEEDSISRSMKRICVSYSHYYNNKHKRVGHVFQDRFRSEKIENDNYLLECIRYIHNNPVKASIVRRPTDYVFSSYNIYTKKAVDDLDLIETEFPLSIFSENNKQALKQFVKFSTNIGLEDFIDISEDETENMDPFKAIGDILNKYSHTIETISTYKNTKERNLILKDIKNNTNISIREISRIIGIGKDTIHRA